MIPPDPPKPEPAELPEITGSLETSEDSDALGPLPAEDEPQ
jgi:hypothetical protein